MRRCSTTTQRLDLLLSKPLTAIQPGWRRPAVLGNGLFGLLVLSATTSTLGHGARVLAHSVFTLIESIRTLVVPTCRICPLPPRRPPRSYHRGIQDREPNAWKHREERISDLVQRGRLSVGPVEGRNISECHSFRKTHKPPAWLQKWITQMSNHRPSAFTLKTSYKRANKKN